MNKAQYRAAKAMIDTPEKHCRSWYAVNARGIHVEVRDPEAVKFCVEGACMYVRAQQMTDNPSWIHLVYAAKELLASLVIKVPDWKGPVVYVNDTLEHQHVMAMLDRAIELAPE